MVTSTDRQMNFQSYELLCVHVCGVCVCVMNGEWVEAKWRGQGGWEMVVERSVVVGKC